MNNETRMVTKQDINLSPKDAWPGAKLDMGNGLLMVITSVTGGDPSFRYEKNPIVSDAERWLSKAGKDNNFSVLLLVRAILFLADYSPLMTMETFAGILRKTMKWPVSLVVARESLGGWPIDDDTEVNFDSPAQSPNVTVNFDPVIEMKVPAVEEEIVDIQRDQAGFIQTATKTRRRKQAALA